ncbi:MULTISPECIES: ribbon-helix-helix domain-containing protein [unclassified Beijerinckia]|uniref:ribbon-helix-helix domain-containing protein n=1 Tax=unclassified Beijerinckia TaxID=2638183 RepID=UPI00089C1C47|nr:MULTISPECIES: ribbon-helix-helix domain-containing protein [unclassified Beijerinckia]MDH7799638.1 putative DNA-binding ribbon-helix-helix protein [Beijerinckia sp. GAS462]SEB48380.1 Predicted DNA-binding protein, contains Ribbon-helix-helix (RHH) domain [Beijerinckia sp. 28-YEA-48]
MTDSPDHDAPLDAPFAPVTKHSLVIAGHRTSISLEAPFWEALKELARERNLSLAALVGEIDDKRGEANLSSALRVFVLRQTQAKLQTAPLPQ